MAATGLSTSPSRHSPTTARADDARSLAARLPDLLVAARRVAANVLLGVHGRRRAGSGETFWQFRPYMPGEPARRIDWRRSARDQHLYVREREWEASQTVWLWADLSPSMDFRSDLSPVSKLDRAVVLMLATAEMLARGGERVGLPGLVEPQLGRNAADRFAAALARAENLPDWPDIRGVKRFSELVIVSDCLSEIDTIRNRCRAVADIGATMHLLQVTDPAEESFPYDGRFEFRDPESGALWLSESAGSLRERYIARLAAHRGEIALSARKAGSTFGVHHTDRPASEGLLFLHSSLSGTPLTRSGAAPANRA
ncbi:Protein of unknown function DUF58 [Faunimonas pinastri]|uniref:DUF58 domain-containing protein n=1 Tax=Faunimonas pinastri TaxID=1855383 RepID=A0A1H9AE11_9HYPH|nr:DUF58 domain-containing protein [Faunimonas pinastri]SEP74761.1 Protein of unknown function DUF58 [Faunimonas pinastri]